MDGSAAHRCLHELDTVRAAVDAGRYGEAVLRIELLERDLAGRDAAVVDLWTRLLTAERARISDAAGASRPA